MKKNHSDKFFIEIEYETLDVPQLHTRNRRSICIYEIDDEDNKKTIFSESELMHGVYPSSRSGIAGAVNLLYGLLLGHENTYYINEEHSCLDKVFKNTACCNGKSGKNACRIGKRLNFFGKLRLKLTQFKLKFFNVFQ